MTKIGRQKERKKINEVRKKRKEISESKKKKESNGKVILGSYLTVMQLVKKVVIFFLTLLLSSNHDNYFIHFIHDTFSNHPK